jgi:uncharacterized protein YoxC
MIWQNGPSTQPFFGNDLGGLLKVLGFLGSIVTIVVMVVIRWGQSSYAKQLDTNTDDLTEIGKKVDRMEGDSKEQQTKHDELRDRVTRNESKVDGLLATNARLEAGVSQLTQQSNELQRDITNLITESSGRISASVNELAKQVASIEGEQRARQTFVQMMDKMTQTIAGAIREGQK